MLSFQKLVQGISGSVIAWFLIMIAVAIKCLQKGLRVFFIIEVIK
jgi:hypothetical protein